MVDVKALIPPKEEIASNLLKRSDCKQLLRLVSKKQKFKLVKFSITPKPGFDSIFACHGKLNVVALVSGRETEFEFEVEHIKNKFITVALPKVALRELVIYQILNQEVVKVSSNDYQVTLPCVYCTENVAIFEKYKDFAFTMHFDDKHTKVAIKALAKLHCSSILLEKNLKKQLGTVYESYVTESLFYNENGTNFQIVYAITKGLCNLVKAKKLNQPNANSMMVFYEQVMQLMHQDNRSCKVICHGNLYFKNILFRYKNSKPLDCKFVGFILMRYAPPAFDFMNLLIANVDADILAENINNLTLYYYNVLAKYLSEENIQISTVFPYYEFEQTCKVYNRPLKFLNILFKIIMSTLEPFLPSIIDDNGFIDDAVCAYLAHDISSIKQYLDELYELLRPTYDYVTREDLYGISAAVHGENVSFASQNLKLLAKYDCFGEHNYYILTIISSANMNTIEDKFFLKSVSRHPFRQQSVIETGAPLKEYGFYKIFIPLWQKAVTTDLDNLIPKCYSASANGTIILQDLSNSYITKDCRETFDMDTVKLVLCKLARFHAYSFIYEEKKSEMLETKYRLNEEFPKLFEETRLLKSNAMNLVWKALERGLLDEIDYFSSELVDFKIDDIKMKISNALVKVFDLLKPSTRGTVIHGELWAGNIMFKKDDNDCIFVDFETVRYNSPVQDVIGFLFLCTSKEFRSEFLRKMVDFYYTNLEQYLEEVEISVAEVINYVEFLISCKENILYGFCMNFMIMHLGTQTLEQQKEFYSTPAMVKEFFFKSRSKRVLTLCNRDPVYKKRQLDIMLEFAEYSVGKKYDACFKFNTSFSII